MSQKCFAGSFGSFTSWTKEDSATETQRRRDYLAADGLHIDALMQSHIRRRRLPLSEASGRGPGGGVGHSRSSHSTRNESTSESPLGVSRWLTRLPNRSAIVTRMLLPEPRLCPAGIDGCRRGGGRGAGLVIRRRVPASPLLYARANLFYSWAVFTVMQRSSHRLDSKRIYI